MLRLPLSRVAGLSTGRFGAACIHSSSSKHQQPQPAPELIEVFIDDKPVHVPPGTTVLKVLVVYIINVLFLLKFNLYKFY